MRANPDASVTEIIRMNGRPRNSTVLSLERLEKAGLVEHAARGKWIAVDPDLLEVPAPKPAGWIEPLSGARVARHAADGRRVRDELDEGGSLGGAGARRTVRAFPRFPQLFAGRLRRPTDVSGGKRHSRKRSQEPYQRLARKNRTLAGNSKRGAAIAVTNPCRRT